MHISISSVRGPNDHDSGSDGGSAGTPWQTVEEPLISLSAAAVGVSWGGHNHYLSQLLAAGDDSQQYRCANDYDYLPHKPTFYKISAATMAISDGNFCLPPSHIKTTSKQANQRLPADLA